MKGQSFQFSIFRVWALQMYWINPLLHRERVLCTSVSHFIAILPVLANLNSSGIVLVIYLLLNNLIPKGKGPYLFRSSLKSSLYAGRDTGSQVPNQCFASRNIQYFFNVYFWERERQSASGGGVERQRDTESEVGSRLWAVSTNRTWCGAWSQELWNHDLSHSQRLNRLNHLGTPSFFVLKA